MNDEIQISIEGDSGSANTQSEQETIIVTDPDKDRYNSFEFISWWKQEVVRAATAMVVGAGALGNEVLKNLALMGIGKIFVVDFDTVEDSNLSRSVLFRVADHGMKKAEAAAHAVRELNPDVAVQWFHGDINHDLGLGVYRRVDVVIGCLDNREARLSINNASWKLNKPWIDGAIQELLGLCRVFVPGHGACYECTLTDEDYRIMGVRKSCRNLAIQNIAMGKVPTTPTISSIIAAMESQEALKILHGMPVDPGKAVVFNGLNNESFTMEYSEKEDCQSHWTWNEIVELPDACADSLTLGALLDIAKRDLGADAYLVIPEFGTTGRCTNDRCANKDIVKHFNRPVYSIFVEEAACPTCGYMLAIDSIERFTGEEELRPLTFSQVGIPPLDVIRAENLAYDNKFYELSGDAKWFFKFEKGNPKSIKSFYKRRKQWLKETN